MAAPGADSSFSQMNAGGDINSRNAGIYAQTVNFNQAQAAFGTDASAIPAVGFEANSAEFNVGRDNMAESQNVLGDNNRVNITNHTQAPPAPPRPPLQRCPPASRNFVGREPELAQLNQFFLGDHVPANKQQIFTVIGIGGCGKTQLVRRFMEDVYDISDNDPSFLVFYVDATTTVTLQASLVSIAKASGLEETSETVLAWMATIRKPFFMYIDNADDPKINLHRYFPNSNRVRILITTRLRDSDQNYGSDLDSAIHLGPLTQEQAVKLLVRSARLKQIQNSDDEGVIRLVQDELFCFALAVAQAGAAIFKMQWTVVEYLARFRQLRTSLMDGENDGVGRTALDDYHSNVNATWRLSYSQLSPPAAHLLGICAHFHHSGITEEIFADAFSGLTSDSYYQDPPVPWAAEEPHAQAFLHSFAMSGAWDVDKFRHCMQEACSLSLLSYENTTRTYSLHPLIHDTLLSVAPHPSQAALLLGATTSSRWDNATLMISLVPHVQRLLSNWKDRRSSDPPLHPMLALRLAEPFYRNGYYNEAEQLQRAALAAYAAKLSPDNWFVSAAKNNLANALRLQRRLHEAEPLQREVVGHRRRLYGEEDPETVWAMSNLASTLQDAGRYDEAEKYYRGAVERVRTADGRYRNSIPALASFAILLCDLGRVEEAEETAAEALEASRRILGEEHSGALHALRTLGRIISQRGRYTEAEPLQRQASEMYRRVFGAHHPDTRVAEANLNWTLARIQEQATAIESKDPTTSTSHSLTSVVAPPSDEPYPSDEPAPSTVAPPTIHVPIPSPSLDGHSLSASTTRSQDAGNANRPHSKNVSLVKRVWNSLKSKSKRSTSNRPPT